MIVGRVASITRYPVKSMAGEPLVEAELDWQGIEGDRQYSFYRKHDPSRFPWLSGRDLNALVRYRASFRDAANPRRSPVDVLTPEGDRLMLDSRQLLAAVSSQAGADLGLIQSARGLYDAMPVSIVTTATFAALDASHDAPLDPRRFRANILIEADVRETEWAGSRLVLGDGADAAELLLADGIPRCVLITVDPDTGLRDPWVMRTVARDYDNRIGIYAAPARPGTIREGDPVRLAS